MNQKEYRRRMVRQVINTTAANIHDATRWDQRDEADEDGHTPMDRLVERIARIYELGSPSEER